MAAFDQPAAGRSRTSIVFTSRQAGTSAVITSLSRARLLVAEAVEAFDDQVRSALDLTRLHQRQETPQGTSDAVSAR